MKRISASLLPLLALGLISPTSRSQVPSPAQSSSPVELITPQLEQFSVGNLTGKPVRGANQDELATVSEFLLDPRTGRVHFAVANAGPKAFRLVPMSALQPGSGPSGLVLSLTRAQWDQIPTMSEQELLGPVTLEASRVQQLQQQFQLPAAEPATSGLLRSTLLNEREVRAGNEPIGKVDDVIIDFHNRISAPLVKVTSAAGAPAQDVLIHFSHLQVNPEPRAPITTSVSAAEIRSPGSSQLTPTGYPSGLNVPGRPEQAGSAALAVQQALDRDASITRGAVQAIAETRIVLRGSVDTEQKRSELERAAQQAAPGVPIENQVMVRSR